MTRQPGTKNYTTRLLIFILLSAIFISAAVFQSYKPKVMILHSYHNDYPWTRDIDAGLERVIKNWNRYTIIRHYMDTKKYNEEKWLKRSGILARRAIDKFKPDVLIAIDDFAQSLAARYYVNQDNMQIVFAGVNGSIDDYGYQGAVNVTGIFEHKLLQPVKEAILALESAKPHPRKRPRLAYLMDPSPSIKKGRARIDSFQWGAIDYRGSFVAQNYSQWQNYVQQLSSEADYLLVSNYRKLPADNDSSSFINAETVMNWTDSHADIPVIGINSFNVEDGAMLSIGVSPYEQGETAAQLAQTIIRKKINAGQLPFIANKMFIIAMNRSKLDNKGLSLPGIYEAFARATQNYIE